MPNGNQMTDRDYLVQIHERVKNMKGDVRDNKDDIKDNKDAVEKVRTSIESHIGNHKWLYAAGASMPPIAYYVIKLLEKLAAQ